ncbi:hypothetical protein SAMN02799624_03119 [Paenibacillus sp. UNC496MF]|uniref:hypothetical protein n=1 Tax=Paenibacillus sp. UNC496MF TaxID=1502753 RepID=UPI0008F287C9|nr:hypothetical protein [Paenibacillus sp. UNC496MF]SFJ03710.1 hypothetical protein SAMN02799624_03119 [Paenibacillus sp. UNC496MF]
MNTVRIPLRLAAAAFGILLLGQPSGTVSRERQPASGVPCAVQAKLLAMTEAAARCAEEADDVRQAAWKRLSDSARRTVDGDWRTAPVALVDWNDVPRWQTAAAMTAQSESRPAYRVTLRTTQDGLLGPIVLYFDQATLAYLGADVRE